jgi:hypothetical protein
MTLNDPTDVLPYVRALRMMLGGYGAYSREKRRETDVAVREEISRCAMRARNHLANVHDNAYRDGNTAIARACKLAMGDIDSLRNDVDHAETGGEHSRFSRHTKINKKTQNQLIKHDHDTLQMVSKAVNVSNDLEDAHAKGEGAEACIQLARSTQQLVSSCRGHFSERRAVLKRLGA